MTGYVKIIESSFTRRLKMSKALKNLEQFWVNLLGENGEKYK